MKQRIIRGMISTTVLSAPLFVHAQVEAPVGSESVPSMQDTGEPTTTVLVSGIRRSLQEAVPVFRTVG